MNILKFADFKCFGIGDMRSTLHQPLSPSFPGKFDTNLAAMKTVKFSE